MAGKKIFLSNGKSLMCPNCKSKNCVCKRPSYGSSHGIGDIGIKRPWRCKCNDCGEKWEQILD